MSRLALRNGQRAMRGSRRAGRTPRARSWPPRRVVASAGGGAAARRPRLPGGQQPEAGRLPRRGACSRRPAPRARPAHGAVGAGPARAPRRVRAAASRGGSTSPSRARRRRAWRGCSFGGQIEIGAIHTYLELFGRYFVDLTPQRRPVVAAQAADADGNLYTGPEHRGHAGHRRGHRLQARHRHRAGQRARRHGAARRHPGRLGRLRRRGRGPSTSSRCSPATRRRSPRSRC